jgi:ribosomal protein L21
MPALGGKTQATVVAHLKGEKIRSSKFKAKVRYRKTTGYRHSMTRIQITKIA